MLYQVVADHLETFLERAQVDGRGLPGFVERELRAFLRCGIKSYGFTRVYCDRCRREYALPFSCQTRGFCPSCCGRFMAATALDLVDHVLPRDAGYRQFVLTLPYSLRFRTAYDGRVQRTVIRGFIDTLRRWYERRGLELGVPDPHWGAVTVVQRVGSALQVTPHPHTIAIDGVFSIDRRGLYARFRPLPAPSEAEIASLVSTVADRVLRALVRRRLIQVPGEEDAGPDPLDVREPAQAACYAASVQGRIAFGPEAGSRIPRVGAPLGADRPRRPLTAESRGFNLHGATTVERGDREGLRRLVKYITRPPLADDRLSLTEDGRVALELKTPSPWGASQVLFTKDAFLQHLCAMVPRPRRHRLLYAGILAPAARHRRLVVPSPPSSAADHAPVPASGAPPQGSQPPDAPALTSDHRKAAQRTRFRRLLWAELMRRSLGTDPLQCACGGRMRLISIILRPEVVIAILRSLGLPVEPPRIRSSRGPPDSDLVEIPWS